VANKNKPWFRKVRWSYIGNSWQGALCYAPYLAVLAMTFVYSIDNSNTIGQALFKLFPAWICATVVMQWFASNRA
jgi:hypothetical protein